MTKFKAENDVQVKVIKVGIAKTRLSLNLEASFNPHVKLPILLIFLLLLAKIKTQNKLVSIKFVSEKGVMGRKNESIKDIKQ